MRSASQSCGKGNAKASVSKFLNMTHSYNVSHSVMIMNKGRYTINEEVEAEDRGSAQVWLDRSALLRCSEETQ